MSVKVGIRSIVAAHRLKLNSKIVVKPNSEKVFQKPPKAIVRRPDWGT